MHLSAYFGKRLHGVLSWTRACVTAGNRLADTVACVDHAHFDHTHHHRHRHIPELTCAFNNSIDDDVTGNVRVDGG